MWFCQLRKTLRGAAVLAVVGLSTLLAVVACSREVPVPAGSEPAVKTLEPVFKGAPVLPPADMSGDGPGTLVKVEPLKNTVGFDTVNASAVRMVYRSTSGMDNRPTEVSGVVVVPPGDAPAGGWPVLSIGHILTGVSARCAPSLAAELGGYAEILSFFVSNGYVVTMTDYEGLGIDGLQHMPLQAETLGNNIIDSVRAARRIAPTSSNRWAAYGIGQGGLAAWAAADRAPTYGQGLEMVGAVAVSPLANMSGMADAAQRGDLPREQYYLYLSVLESLANSPARLDLDDYISERVKDNVNVEIRCAPLDPNAGDQAVAALSPNDIRPRDVAATARLRDAIANAAVPLDEGGPAAPVLVVYATEDPTVPAAWIEDAVRTACQRSDPVEVNRRIGDTNTSNDLVTQTALSWLGERFDGRRVVDVCVGVE
jgi:pimeloyl-ACP methyl ester carboxylesterase